MKTESQEQTPLPLYLPDTVAAPKWLLTARRAMACAVWFTLQGIVYTSSVTLNRTAGTVGGGGMRPARRGGPPFDVEALFG